MTEINTISDQVDQNLSKTRMIAGGIVFITGQFAPLFIPLVISSGLSSTWKTTLSGILMLGIPELAIVIAVIILGKSGFMFLKQKIFTLFKKLAPPDVVSKTRYTIGLVLFAVPLFMGWLLPYFTDIFTFFENKKLYINLAGDFMFIISLFVLGGDFWDKIRSLFVYNSKVIIN